MNNNQLVRERDEARAEVEQMHARADHATAELLALGRELKQARDALTEEQETYRLLADHIEKLLPVPDDDVAEVALLMAAIDDVVKERDQARRLVEYRDAELHKRWNQMAEMELLRDKLRADCDRAVAEAAVLRMRLDKMYPPTFRDDDGVLRERASPLDRLVPLATHAAAVLAAAQEWLQWGDSALSRLASAVDAYRAALAGESEVLHG